MFILAISCLKWSEVRVAQSCLTPCDPMDYTVHGILQARILEWVAILQGIFSRGSSEPRDRSQVSRITDGFFTRWFTREAHFLLDHIQFTLIHGPNIRGSYAALFCTALDFSFITDTSTSEHRFCFGPAASFFLELLVIVLCSFQIAYWTTSNPGGSSFGVIFSFSFFFFLSFYTVPEVLMANILEWFTIPSSSGSHFVRTLHYDPSDLGDPAWHGS